MILSGVVKNVRLHSLKSVRFCFQAVRLFRVCGVRLYVFKFKFKKSYTLIHLFDDDRARSGKLTRPALFVKEFSALCEGMVRQNNKSRQIRYRRQNVYCFN